MPSLAIFCVLFLGVAFADEHGTLDAQSTEFLGSLVDADTKLLASESVGKLTSGGSMSSKGFPASAAESFLKAGGSMLSPLSGAETFLKAGQSLTSKSLPLPGASILGKGKVLVAATAAVPIKKAAVVKKVVAAKVVAPKLKMTAFKKPVFPTLKPIIHIINKPVPVFHKVPVPKKVIVPKFYPVFKPIPVPKIVHVPHKVPVFKIIPKIVKIPKAIPVPKFIPVKKPIPIGIPFPVPKFHKVPVPKLMPYKKYIPIPIPKKVPKFVPFPVKKVIKVPKPYYVPIKVPHITASYVKTPMMVDVPDVKKTSKFTGHKPSFMQIIPQGGMNALKFLDGNLGGAGSKKRLGPF